MLINFDKIADSYLETDANLNVGTKKKSIQPNLLD